MSAARYPTHHRLSRCAVSFIPVCLVVLAIAISTASPVLAQEDPRDRILADYPDWPYIVIPVPEELLDPRVPEEDQVDRAERSLRPAIQMMFNNDQRPGRSLSEPENQAKFDQYFRDLLFRRWTYPQYLKIICDDRELILRFLELSKSEPARERLHGLITSNMPKIATGNFHPALRYNAMLLLGQLNSKEAVKFTPKSPAVPLIEILPGLVEEVVNENQIDAVRVAALIGIQRHAEGNLPAGAKQEVINRLLPILAQAAPQNRTPEAHAWIQRRVVNILGAMESAGAGDAVIKGLRSIVADPDQPTSLRCAAAAALAPVGLGAADPKEVAGEMGSVAAEACREELAWLRNGIKKRRAELKSLADDERSERAAEDDMFGGGGTTVSLGDPVIDRLSELSRRRLKSRLIETRTGLTAAVAGSPEAANLGKTVVDILKNLDNTKSSPDDLQADIEDGTASLDAQVKKILGADAGPPRESTAPEPDGPDGPDVPDGPDDGPTGPDDELGPDL